MNTTVSGTAPGQRQLNGDQTSGRTFRNVSEPTYSIVEDLDTGVEVRDGTKLMVDVYRPDDDGTFPALLSFSCYPRQIQNLRIPLGLVEAGASDFFVPRGYVHVIANARGTSGSEGVWGLLDAQERNDLYDLIEWAASQTWCNGNVGMLGISYFAMAQIAAAVTKPPSLKAIFPLGTNENVWDVARHHGLYSQSFMSAWFPAVGVLAAKGNDLWRSKKIDILGHLMSNKHVHSRLAQVNGEALMGVLKNVFRSHIAEEPYGRLWQQTAVEHPSYDAFWAERNSLPLLADVDIPVYLGCDWNNVIMHLPGTFTSWRALTHNPNVRMSMLPDGGLNWPWESMHEEALAWYDHWLKGIDTGVMDGPPIRCWLPEANEWRTSDVWPPSDSRLVPYTLAADGSLDPNPGDTTGERSYLYLADDLERPRAANDPEPPHALTWDTTALDAPLDIAGNIELHLDATITSFDTAWMTLLFDVAPDGTQHAITGGWLRAMLRKVDEDGSIPGAPVVPCDEPTAVPLGETVTYRIPIVPNARRVATGHKLRLTISSADAGHDSPKLLGFAHTPVGGSTLNTIKATSKLLLPVTSPNPPAGWPL